MATGAIIPDHIRMGSHFPMLNWWGRLEKNTLFMLLTHQWVEMSGVNVGGFCFIHVNWYLYLAILISKYVYHDTMIAQLILTLSEDRSISPRQVSKRSCMPFTGEDSVEMYCTLLHFRSTNFEIISNLQRPLSSSTSLIPLLTTTFSRPWLINFMLLNFPFSSTFLLCKVFVKGAIGKKEKV